MREHILKNIYGFEYLIAPYTIAHLKLSQFLRDRGHPLKDNERLQVFLTNTLEPIEPQKNFLLPAISEEVKAAQGVKDKPILVILRNPPYSYRSKNNGVWIVSRIDEYKFVDGVHLKEKVTQGLQDDYVKFIRFAQWKMESVEEGIVGIITNHSWIDNPTFRGMRNSLMQTFNQIFVLDLHGNAKKHERTPDGSDDQNVFDIEQGVAISLFIKRKGMKRAVLKADLWGKRLQKYEASTGLDFSDMNWQRLEPKAPFYLFIAQDKTFFSEYEKGISLPIMFLRCGSGMMTNRDHLTIHFTEDDIWKTVARFSSISEATAREEFALGKDARDWKVLRAQEDLRLSGPKREFVKPVQYRPFDIRYTYKTGRARGFIGWPVEQIWRNIVNNNIALGVSRLTKGETFAHAIVSEYMFEKICLSPKTSNNAFVFLLRDETGAENLAPAFRDYIDNLYGNNFDAEQIFGYIYAILHAPIYRRRYAEFLRIDFPRIPFAEKSEDFEKLSKLGTELIEAHLLRKFPRRVSPTIMDAATTASRSPAMSKPKHASLSTRRNPSRPCPKTFGSFTSAAIRCSTNI